MQSAIEEFAYYSDEPNADAGALPVWFLSKLSKTKTTVSSERRRRGRIVRRISDLSRESVGAERAAAARLGISAALRRACACWPVSDEKISFEYKAEALPGRLPDAAASGRTSIGTELFPTHENSSS